MFSPSQLLPSPSSELPTRTFTGVSYHRVRGVTPLPPFSVILNVSLTPLSSSRFSNIDRVSPDSILLLLCLSYRIVTLWCIMVSVVSSFTVVYHYPWVEEVYKVVSSRACFLLVPGLRDTGRLRTGNSSLFPFSSSIRRTQLTHKQGFSDS